MNTRKIKLILGVAALAIVLPQLSHAYSTTAQSATRLSDDTFLFTITYRFGFLNRELKMPIGAIRADADYRSPYTRYAVLADGEPSTIGVSSAVVLSTASIVDNEYYLPEGRAADFTLAAIVKIPPKDTATPDQLSLGITALPFTMIDDGEEVLGSLTAEMLPAYKTPELTPYQTGLIINRAVSTAPEGMSVSINESVP